MVSRWQLGISEEEKLKWGKQKAENKRQKQKAEMGKAEIAGFRLLVFLHFSFQLSTFSFSFVAGVADPGRGAERFSERLLSRQTLGSRGAAEHAERIQSSSLRALRASA